MKHHATSNANPTTQKDSHMKVRDLMTTDVNTCQPHDGLDIAARLMWANDCGSLPVLDEDGHLVGMITDRDICMAALTQGGPLTQLRVESAMAGHVYSCEPEDSLPAAEALMRLHQIRRLPVIAADGRLAGILSLSDLAREATRHRSRKKKADVTADGLTQTLAAVSQPHDLGSVATAM
jgi:CBS domain-containing protein